MHGAVRYRVLCLSRNLTFDRAWDTCLVLDGELIARTNAFSVNHPLGDLIRDLSNMTVRPVPAEVRKKLRHIEAEIRKVKFELPEGFDAFGFWTIGLEGSRVWPFQDRIDRLLVVSPFLSDSRLQELSAIGGPNLLVSRLEALTAANQTTLQKFQRVFLLSPNAASESTETEDVGLSGLHAKLFIADAGRDAHVWAGSANAAFDAFDHNVEFLVQLTGSKSRCGIDAFLSRPDSAAADPVPGFSGAAMARAPVLDVRYSNGPISAGPGHNAIGFLEAEPLRRRVFSYAARGSGRTAPADDADGTVGLDSRR